MKIAFICGCLETGKDGVGDYTRRLAERLSSLEYEVLLIALNDRHIYSSDKIVYKSEGGSEIIRVSSTLPEAQRFIFCKQALDRFNPAWISLQFVIFSFQPKGLPIGLNSKIKYLIAGRKFHIMFHELWVGVNGVANFKNLLLRAVQKHLIKKIIFTTNPNLITTSIPIYKTSLKSYNVRLLPLFGNIPVHKNVSKFLPDENVFRIVHFGSFTSDLEGFKNQIVYASLYAKKFHKVLKFEIIGNGGPAKSAALLIANSIIPKPDISDHGLLPAQDISQIILGCNWGISRADGILYGKSGSTLTFLEHGLPVLLRGQRFNSQNEYVSSEFDDRLIFVGDDYDLIPEKNMPDERVVKVAKIFQDFLQNF